MLYALRTHDLRPGALAEVERRLSEPAGVAAPGRPPTVVLRTEIGPLNQVIELREATPGAPGARADAVEEILAAGRLRLTSESYRPMEFSPPFPPDRVAAYYELRIYDYAEDDDLDRLAAAWRVALPARLSRGPLAAAWRAEPAWRRRFVHLWPYDSLDERARLRRELRASGDWPPPAVAAKRGLPPFRLLRQENRLLVPIGGAAPR